MNRSEPICFGFKIAITIIDQKRSTPGANCGACWSSPYRLTWRRPGWRSRRWWGEDIASRTTRDESDRRSARTSTGTRTSLWGATPKTNDGRSAEPSSTFFSLGAFYSVKLRFLRLREERWPATTAVAQIDPTDSTLDWHTFEDSLFSLHPRLSRHLLAFRRVLDVEGLRAADGCSKNVFFRSESGKIKQLMSGPASTALEARLTCFRAAEAKWKRKPATEVFSLRKRGFRWVKAVQARLERRVGEGRNIWGWPSNALPYSRALEVPTV